jgi:epoxyqueuosine reductase
MDKKLKALSQRLTAEGLIQPNEARWFCDAGPINERAWAMAAGLGAQGKNGLLLHPALGSALYLGVGLLGVETDADARTEPIADLCGRCRLCVDACPTGAINPDRTIDSKKCIAYWTIEADGDAPQTLSERFGQWWFGCDICRRCCPRQPPPAPVDPDLAVRPEYLTLTFDRLLTMSESEFNEVFQASAVRRAGLEKIMRTIQSLKRNYRPIS